MRRDNTSADYATLTGQLKEAGQQQTRLKEALYQSENLVENLEGQLEESRTEKEELSAELDLLRIKVRRLERSTTMTDGDSREDTGTALSSNQLDARAPVFGPTVCFSTVEEMTPQDHAVTTDASGAIVTMRKGSKHETTLPVSGQPPPQSGTGVTSSVQVGVNAPTDVSSSTEPTHTSMGTNLLT